MPFFEVPQIQFEQRQVSQELQFLDKVVDELVLCNDRCSKGFAHRQGRRRASGHASVYGCFWKIFLLPRDGEPRSRGRFSSRTGHPDHHEPLLSGSHFPQFTKAFGIILFFFVEVDLC